VHDDLSKHGLIFAELLNGVAGSDASAVSLVIEGILILNCHSAVGSALTVSGLTVELTHSQFVNPLCLGNVVYLNQTDTTISECLFKGYEDISDGGSAE
jgi:hypothetical protein